MSDRGIATLETRSDAGAATPRRRPRMSFGRREAAGAGDGRRRRGAHGRVRAGTIRRDRMTSRRACARRSARCASGLRMRRVATVLSGSACCVYGLTFVSHFYGARRSVGYVPFNSETLVTGKLFEDIREAVHKLADPAHYDAIIVTNLCVPTASGVPLRLLPKSIRRRADHRNRRAGLRHSDPCRGQGRSGRGDACLCPRRDRGGSGGRAGSRPLGPSDGDAARRDVPGGSR